MEIKENELAKRVGCCKVTLNLYLCRAEFSHITFFYNNLNEKIISNIKEKDIEKLYKLRHRRDFGYINNKSCLNLDLKQGEKINDANNI